MSIDAVAFFARVTQSAEMATKRTRGRPEAPSPARARNTDRPRYAVEVSTETLARVDASAKRCDRSRVAQTRYLIELGLDVEEGTAATAAR